MANIPPIQFKRSHKPGAVPAAESLSVGELALNLKDAIMYSKDSDGTIVTLGGGEAFGDSDGGIRTRLWKDGSAEILPNAEHLLYKIESLSGDEDWYLEAGAVNGDFGTTAEILTYFNGTRTDFDDTTEVWLDGTTIINQAPSSSLTLTMGNTNLSTNLNDLRDHFLDVNNVSTIDGYSPSSFSANNQARFGISGFADGNDYLIRFWFTHDNVSMSNNYTRLFGFTTCDISQTGSTSGTVDPLFRPDGFFVGTTNNSTQGRVVEDGSQIGTNFTVPNSKSWNTTGGKMIATFSATYVSTGVWVCRFWLDNVHIATGSGIDLTATNQHFQFGTGNSADDRDGQCEVTHIQVDKYTAGDMDSQYSINTIITETNPIFTTTPTKAYDVNYDLSGYEEYKKIGEKGDNTAAHWLKVI